MSAAVVVLPQVWAMSQSPSLMVVGEAGGRIGPASVRLARPKMGIERASKLYLVKVEAEAKPEPAPAPQLAFYRKYTEGMLRRYLKLSMAGGRVSSLLGRELFHGKVANYRVRGFDDVIIFVRDVEQCIAKLGYEQGRLIDRIAIQGYTQFEVARMLRMTRSTTIRMYGEALDELTALFIDRKLLHIAQLCQ